jgi:hypothetical protein
MVEYITALQHSRQLWVQNFEKTLADPKHIMVKTAKNPTGVT